jgi:molecular chaperone DnaK
VVGIDLGTTNSAVAYMAADGRPACIPNTAGDTLTPSVVCFRPPAPWGDANESAAAAAPLVGRAARAAQVQHPSTTYYSAKRLIGRSWASPAVQEEAARLAYEVGCAWRECSTGVGECLPLAAVPSCAAHPTRVTAGGPGL